VIGQGGSVVSFRTIVASSGLSDNRSEANALVAALPSPERRLRTLRQSAHVQ